MIRLREDVGEGRREDESQRSREYLSVVFRDSPDDNFTSLAYFTSRAFVTVAVFSVSQRPTFSCHIVSRTR